MLHVTASVTLMFLWQLVCCCRQRNTEAYVQLPFVSIILSLMFPTLHGLSKNHLCVCPPEAPPPDICLFGDNKTICAYQWTNVSAHALCLFSMNVCGPS
jgi:hypothetical protein